uniref:Uncharacterized protein n=1 Tax=Lepeophtheirus salmonis TaxID=72036 RepID=A0A0K2UWS0_LEPSM
MIYFITIMTYFHFRHKMIIFLNSKAGNLVVTTIRLISSNFILIILPFSGTCVNGFFL